MKGFWIFVIGAARPDRDVFVNKSEFEMLMDKNKCWGLGARTPFVKKIKTNDRGVFYLAGKSGQRFIAKFTIASNPYPISQRSKDVHPAIRSWCDYLINLKNMKVFKSDVRVDEIKDQLELTKGTFFWRSCFQGGIRKISEKDFNSIVKASNS